MFQKPLKTQPDKQAARPPHLAEVPRHIAIIMDGNGRWARQRALPRLEGHRRGAESVREIVRACGEWGIEFLTLYAFSAENWKRPKSEIEALMRLLEKYLRDEVPELRENNVRLRAIGRLSDLPERVQRQLQQSIEATANNTGLTLILALSYGSRGELVEAAKRIAQEVRDGKLTVEQIDEAAISRRLYTAEYPDPDLLIRTSGEMRLSNFLLWQISYSELWVTKTLWPDFRRDHLLRALQDYNRRHRRFGGV
jgi:undecaprenyl diphosphate synthase